MTKTVEVASIDTQVFMKEVFRLFQLGATYEGGIAIRRPHMAVQLEVEESVNVGENANTRVIPKPRDSNVSVQVIANSKPKPAPRVAKKAAKKATKKQEEPKEAPKEEQKEGTEDK